MKCRLTHTVRWRKNDVPARVADGEHTFTRDNIGYIPKLNVILHVYSDAQNEGSAPNGMKVLSSSDGHRPEHIFTRGRIRFYSEMTGRNHDILR